MTENSFMEYRSFIMSYGKKLKALVLFMGSLILFGTGTYAYAVSGTGIGSVAANVSTNLGNIALLVTGGAYLGGMAFAILGIVKLKAHKDNPTQIPISTGFVLLFVGAALMFIPSVFQTSGS